MSTATNRRERRTLRRAEPSAPTVDRASNQAAPLPPLDANQAAHAMRTHMLSGIVRGLVNELGPCDAIDIAMGIAGLMAEEIQAKPEAPSQVLYALEMARRLREYAIAQAPNVRENSTKRIEIAGPGARVNGKVIA